MGLIDGADKNLDGASAPSNPMLEPPLNNTSSVFSNIANLIITASLLLNILWISTMPMDIHDIHGYDQSIHGYIHGYPYPRQAWP